MPGASQVSIINGALDHIACKPIVGIADASPQAQAAVRAWSKALQASLREATPGFATAIVALTLHATYVPLHWLFAYTYPANCLAMNKVYNEGTVDPTVGEEFREVYHPTTNEKIIVTNCDLAYGEYTFDLTDTTLFDASFVKTLEYRLAADLAAPLVRNKELEDSMDKKFIISASECARYNAYEQKNATKQKSSFVDAR